MPFDSLSAFLHMGGHAPYVWLAYGVGLLLIAYNLLAPRLRFRQLRTRILRMSRSDQEIP